MKTVTAGNPAINDANSAGNYAYSLVAHPDKPVNEKIMAEKQFFSNRFSSPVADNAKPYITLASFMAYESMEETIIRWMHRIISSKKCFSVTLNRFGAFGSHAIYLGVQDQEPFRNIAGDLKVVDQYISNSGCPKMHISSHPHLIIAQKLDREIYQQAVTVYAEKTFQASFTVTDLVLLRRQHAFDNCRQVNVFGLLP